jgi:RHS repeat-associated protein
MQRAPRVPRRLALCALAAVAAAGCPSHPPLPVAGAPDHQAVAFVPVPLARVNAAGGNLLVAREDLDFDTRLGNVAVGASWSSAARAWRWSFELEYDGARFVDASGAVYDLRAVASGAAIPGSVWVKLDARTLRSKGGLVHEFGPDGRLAAVRWASGPWPRLEYRMAATEAGPRVAEIVQLSGPAEAASMARLGWDASGRLASVEDRAGRRALFGWNAAGELVQARGPFDVARGLPGLRYGYEGGWLVSIETSEGVRAEYGYVGGRLASARAVGLGSPETRFAYSSRASGGFETRVTDALGGVTRLGWDAQRRVTDLTNAAGDRTRWTFAGLRPASVTAPDGSETRWTVADDEVVEERQASGRVVALAYEPAAEDRGAPWRRPLRRASDALGVLVERAYDAQGRLVRETNGAGESTTFGWSGQNLLATVTDPTGLETRYGDRGEHGHPRRVERGGIAESLDYDATGNLLVGRGNGLQPPGVVARGYDEDRNLSRLELADLDQVAVLETRTLAIEHRSDGQVARIVRPFGGDSEFVYDALGRMAERRDRADGVWRATRFVHDALGRPTEVERPNGMRTRVEYDAAGRRTSVVHLRGGAFDGGASFTWRAGRLEAVSDAAHAFGEERIGYDAAGRVASVAYPEGEVLELGYDARSRLASERYRLASGASLRALEHRYDGADRQTELRDGDAVLVRRELSGGRLARETFGNGLTRSYAYDGDGFLSEASLRTAAGALVERSRLEREAFTGLVPGVAWRASTETFGALPAATYEHYWLAPVGDGAAGARVGGFARDADGVEVEPLAYDVLGNLLRVGAAGEAGARTFQYDAEHSRLRRIRLGSGDSLHDYTWDEAGFALSRDGEPLAWDGGGRPVSVGTRASFAWDAVGRPVSARVDGIAVRMLFGGRVRADAGGAPVAIELGAVRLHVLGHHHYRHADFRGNVKLVTDAAGRVVSHARYGPYGADLVHGAPDPEAGFARGRAAGGDLLLLGARLYDPDAARFLAPDPVLQRVGQHAYADGNPVWFWDPDGRAARSSVGFAIGVGVVGMHVGLAVIAFGAAPVAITAGAAIYAYSAAYTLGAVAPDASALAGFNSVVAATIALGARAWAPASIPAAGLSGFEAGQTFQGFRVHSPPQPRAYKDDARGVPGRGGAVPVDANGWSVSGPTAAPGCSPVSLADGPRARELIVRLAGVQLALALALFWQRSKDRKRGARHGEA